MDKREKITEIVQRLADRPVDLLPDQSLFDSGFVDSFTLVELVTALEAEFSIQIPVSHLTPRRFDTISHIEAYVESRSCSTVG